MAYVVLALGVALGAAVQSAIGFGAMLVATLIGATVLETDLLMPILLPISTLQSGVLVLRHRDELDRAVLFGRILPGVWAGVALGTALVGVAVPGLARALGVGVLVLSAIELRRAEEPLPLPAPVAGAALVVGGVVQAAIGTGGPLVVWAVGRQGLAPATFRTTLNATWFATNVVLAGVLAWGGRFTSAALATSAWMLVPGLVGVAVGMAVHHRLDPRSFRRALWLVLAACSIPLLLR